MVLRAAGGEEVDVGAYPAHRGLVRVGVRVRVRARVRARVRVRVRVRNRVRVRVRPRRLSPPSRPWEIIGRS